MSDASTSNEVGKKFLENYDYPDGERPIPTFYYFDIDLEKLKSESTNPNGTSGVVTANPKEAGQLDPVALLVGIPPVVIAVNTVSREEKDRVKDAITGKAKQTGGVGLGEGGVAEYINNQDKYRNVGREI